MKKLLTAALVANVILLVFRMWQQVPPAVEAGGAVGACADDRTLHSIDSNGDSSVNISDAVHLLTWLFSGGPPPQVCLFNAPECNSWIKVYENGADGTSLSGNLLDLVGAIRAGADVKVRYFAPTFHDVVWFRRLPSVTITEGVGGTLVVSGMLTTIPDTDFTLTHGREFEEPFAVEWQTYNTSGRRQTTKFDRQTSALISKSTTNTRMAWYVRSGCWQKLYEHNSSGTATSGRVRDLERAVQAGVDVKAAYAIRSGGQTVEWFRAFNSVTVAEDEDQGTPVVSGMLTHVPDSSTNSSIGREFETPFATEWQAYNTSGRRQTIKFNAQTASVISNDLSNLGIAWFVRE